MNVSSIGIQTIQSSTGVRPQAPAETASDDSSGHRQPAPQAPPSPGTGQIVDKTV